MKSSQAISHVRWFEVPDVSRTISVPILRVTTLTINLRMGAGMVAETSETSNHLTWLISW
jgi:hypothetical protein